MEKQGWKILAIVFICLFVLETALLVWITSIGTSMVINEEKCGSECGLNPDAGFYQYDEYLSQCYCLNGEGEVVKTINY